VLSRCEDDLNASSSGSRSIGKLQDLLPDCSILRNPLEKSHEILVGKSKKGVRSHFHPLTSLMESSNRASNDKNHVCESDVVDGILHHYSWHLHIMMLS
jgi:hypothetical protein